MCICRAERRAERIDRIGKSRQHSLRTPIYDSYTRVRCYHGCYARLRPKSAFARRETRTKTQSTHQPAHTRPTSLPAITHFATAGCHLGRPSRQA